jgi:hypothetical protein
MKSTITIVFSLMLCFVVFPGTIRGAMSQPNFIMLVAAQPLVSESPGDYEPDLYINGSETFSVHDRIFNATGTVNVQDNATLEMRNATLILTRPLGSPTNDVLIATDRAHVLIEDSTLIINNNGHDPEHGDYVTFSEYNQAEMNITRSTFQGRWQMDQVRIRAFDASVINIKDSNLTEQLTDISEPGEVAVYGSANASLHILNSTLSALGLKEYSTASVRNCDLNYVFAGETSHRDNAFDNMSLSLMDSRVISSVMGYSGFCRFFIQNSAIHWLVIGPNSSAYIENTSGNQLDVEANSEALLVHSSWNHINSHGSGRILVGDWFFGLPFPGIAGVPYTWVSSLETFIIAVAIVGVVTSVYVGVRRTRRHSDRVGPSLTECG